METKDILCRCVVRLKTSIWKDDNGLHLRKDLTYMKRLSFEFNILKEDAVNIGANEVMDRIDNLNDCKDGLYEVVTCNETREYESGMIDDYDYTLIPWKS